MKKLLNIVLLIIVLILFVTGCTDKNNTELSFTHGRGAIKLTVPKDIYGDPMYDMFFTKPDELPVPKRFYLLTNDAFIGVADTAYSYNTSDEYKAKYGNKKATFDNFLEYTEDAELFNKDDYPGLKQIKINGRRALRYYNREEDTYYGFSYIIEADDIYPGSMLDVVAYYRSDLYDLPTKPRRFDDDTENLIKSIKLIKNNK